MTRSLALDFTSLRFNEAGLIPVVAQDDRTGEVRMVAWANRDALEKTAATGAAHYFSRSRGMIWRKGEISGATQHVEAVRADCDSDAVLYLLHQTGAACHSGARNCFTGKDDPPHEQLTRGALPAVSVLPLLAEIIASRRGADPEKSYTAKLLSGTAELPARKVGEEAQEVVLAAIQGQRDKLPHEAADLIYHLLVLLEQQHVPFAEVQNVLRERMK